MQTKKLVLSKILVWLAGSILGMLTCGWLFTWVYEIAPIIWISPEEMMATGNMIGMYTLSLIMSLFFVLVYEIFYKGIPGKKGVKKGMTYGFLISMVSAIGMATMPFYMTIAWTVVIYWVIQAIVFNVIKGAIVGAIYK